MGFYLRTKKRQHIAPAGQLFSKTVISDAHKNEQCFPGLKTRSNENCERLLNVHKAQTRVRRIAGRKF
jgi:hypothetical protein